MSKRLVGGYSILLIQLCALSAACGGEAATGSPTVPPAAIAVGPAANSPVTPAPPAASSPAAPSPATTSMSGPVVGFYIEDSYEDVYLSIFDVGTGAFRVLTAAGPAHIGEGQWFDRGCRVFINGQLLDLHGFPEWSVPPEVAGRIEQINAARLSPQRNYLTHIVPSGGEDDEAAVDAIEIISLSPPYAASRVTTRDQVPRTLAWSADEAWVYFTDNDANGILQVFRVSPDGSTTEQLTAHTMPVALINSLSLSPDGRYLAYSVANLLAATQPYTYQPADEGWVGIVDLTTGASVDVRPAKFGRAEAGNGLVWDEAGENLLIVGDSLPVGEDDPEAGRRVIWTTSAGEVTQAIATAAGPGGADGHIGWIAPLGDINTLLVNALNEFYVYAGGDFRRLEGAQAPPAGSEPGRRVITILPAPIGFPGEAACDS